MGTIEDKIKRAILISLSVVLILSVIQVIPFEMISKTVKAQGTGTDDWWMFRHDMNRTGNTTSRAPNILNLENILWTHQTAPTGYTWGYCGSPAVAGGLVFQGGNRPNWFRAIDAETGVQSWSILPGERVTTSPTMINDRVLFGSYDNQVYSVNVFNPIDRWTANLNVDMDSSPTVYNGKVYIGTGRGDYVATQPSLLYCLDENNGNVIWTFQANGQIISSPTIVDDQVIFGSYDKKVYALPAEDPNGDGTIDLTEVIWVFNADTRVVSSAAVEDGVVYFGGWNGKLYAIPFTDPNSDGTISSDEVIWEFTAGNEIWGSPGIANGRIFIGSHDYYLYSLPKKDPNGDGIISPNEVIWKFQTTDKIWSSPSIAGGKVFIASEDYTLWALCEETGELIWNYVMPVQTDPFGSELLFATPAIVDGRIYIGNYDLTLYCFGNDTDLIPPLVSSVMPINNSVNVSLNSNIEINFNEDLCEPIINDASIIMQSSSGEYLTGRIIYNNTTRTLMFDPDEDFQPNERYTVRLISRYFQDYAGNFLDGNENGNLDPTPEDDYIWYFETGKLVGHKPKLENAYVTPEQGYLYTDFEFFVTYYDEDNDKPIAPFGYIKIFIDDSIFGQEMIWANDSNTPDFHVLDGDYTNGELFHLKTQLSNVGEHKFYIECSDGSNTNRTPEFPLPTLANTQPDLSIPIQYINEGEEYILDLSLYVQDIDNDTTSLTFNEDSEHCEIVDDHLLSCLFPDDDLLSEVVNISVSDGINLVWQDVLFIINPTNDPPTLKPGITKLPSVTVDEDSVFDFDLSEYVMDTDTPIELLQTSDDSEYLTPDGLNLYLLYPHPPSYENVSLTISDGPNDLQLYFEVYIRPLNATQEDGEPDDQDDLKIKPDDDSEFLFLIFLLIILIILLILINLWMIYSRREQGKEALTKTKSPHEKLPPPPSWMMLKEEEKTPPLDEDIPEDKVPQPEDEELPPPEEEKPKDDLLPPENGDQPQPKNEKLPPPEEEIQEDDLPPPDDWEEEHLSTKRGEGE